MRAFAHRTRDVDRFDGVGRVIGLQSSCCLPDTEDEVFLGDGIGQADGGPVAEVY